VGNLHFVFDINMTLTQDLLDGGYLSLCLVQAVVIGEMCSLCCVLEQLRPRCDCAKLLAVIFSEDLEQPGPVF